MQAVKDERKKQLVEKISNQLKELNERMMNHFSNVLEKLEKILAKIGSRADKAVANGVDVSAVRTAITAAEQVIAASREAIKVQLAKVYVPTVSTEDNLRVDVGGARQALHADLVRVRDTVVAAREAVRKVHAILAQIPKVDELEDSTQNVEPSTNTSSNTQ